MYFKFSQGTIEIFRFCTMLLALIFCFGVTFYCIHHWISPLHNQTQSSSLKLTSLLAKKRSLQNHNSELSHLHSQLIQGDVTKLEEINRNILRLVPQGETMIIFNSNFPISLPVDPIPVTPPSDKIP